MATMSMTTVNDRRKKAELLSSVGAGVLGGGLALLLRQFLEPYAIAILGVGLIMHGWGMYSKRSLEDETESHRARWEEVFYWGCWVALLTLAVYITLRWLSV